MLAFLLYESVTSSSSLVPSTRLFESLRLPAFSFTLYGSSIPFRNLENFHLAGKGSSFLVLYCIRQVWIGCWDINLSSFGALKFEFKFEFKF